MSLALLSQGAYIEVATSISTSVAFAAAGKTITRTVGSWITDGVVVGDRLTSNAVAVGNQGPLTVTAVTATVITVAEVLVDEAAAVKTVNDFAQIAEVTSFNTPAASRPDIDVTHLQSTAREFRKGLTDNGSISGECNFVPDDRGQLLLKTMKGEPETPRFIALTIPAKTPRPGYRWSFLGLLTAYTAAVGVDAKVNGSFDIRVSGAITEVAI